MIPVVYIHYLFAHTYIHTYTYSFNKKLTFKSEEGLSKAVIYGWWKTLKILMFMYFYLSMNKARLA